MKTNVARAPIHTHEGAKAKHVNLFYQLRRSVLACLLWEDTFYEDGEQIADRISNLAGKVPPERVARLADEARNVHNLRHVSLVLAAELAEQHRHYPAIAQTIERVIQRADELAEFLSLYWRHGKKPLSAQVKKGLAAAFRKFDAYQLSKYDRKATIRLRDVMFLVHPKPKDEVQAKVWEHLANETLDPPDTWETGALRGENKRDTFTRQLREGKLGYMALLRNLRSMTSAGVDETLIRNAILDRRGAHRVLPFRFIAAARACPRFEPALNKALLVNIEEAPQLSGRTIVLVDVSASMNATLSSRSDLTRMDAAATLAAVIPSDNLRVFTFSYETREVPPRRGMAGVDAVIRSQPHGGTWIGRAIKDATRYAKICADDRLIVITDEQSHDPVGDPPCPNAYMINVASYKNGVGYGAWTHLDGFSESVIRWIQAIEGGESS